MSERMLVSCALKKPCSDWRYQTLHHRQKPAELCYRKGRVFNFLCTSHRIRCLLETVHLEIRVGKKRIRVNEIASTEHAVLLMTSEEVRRQRCTFTDRRWRRRLLTWIRRVTDWIVVQNTGYNFWGVRTVFSQHEDECWLGCAPHQTMISVSSSFSIQYIFTVDMLLNTLFMVQKLALIYCTNMVGSQMCVM